MAPLPLYFVQIVSSVTDSACPGTAPYLWPMSWKDLNHTNFLIEFETESAQRSVIFFLPQNEWLIMLIIIGKFASAIQYEGSAKEVAETACMFMW